jgi:hypothetical protein
MPPPDRVPAQLRDGPFTVEQARAAGVSPEQLRGRRYRKLFRGVYVSAALQDTLELRCRAIRHVLPSDAVFSHFTAAELYDLPLHDALVHVSASSPQRRPNPRAGVRFHESIPLTAVRTYHRLPVTTPERTFLDLAGQVNLVELVILGDAMLRPGLATRESLREAVAAAARRRGVCRAREALAFIRNGVDSPMETRLRLLLVFAGLPCPEINVDLYDEYGHWFSRPDLSYPELKLGMEYEGDTHRTDKRQWRADMTRHEVLHDLGWTVLRFHADDVLLRPHATVERVRRWINEKGPRRS